jgi:hypothetical protein
MLTFVSRATDYIESVEAEQPPPPFSKHLSTTKQARVMKFCKNPKNTHFVSPLSTSDRMKRSKFLWNRWSFSFQNLVLKSTIVTERFKCSLSWVRMYVLQSWASPKLRFIQALAFTQLPGSQGIPHLSRTKWTRVGVWRQNFLITQKTKHQLHVTH